MASASRSVGALEGTAKSAGSAFGSAVGRLMPLAAAAAGAAALTMANDFDRSFARISALSNASTADIERWRDEVLDLGRQTAQAPTELADALFFLSSAGLETGQIMDALDRSARAAAVGLGSTTDVAKITANALNAYAESGLTAAEVTDTLVAAVREGSAEPEEFAAALGRILPIAAQAGVEFDEVTASLATLSNIGLDVNEGVTAMRGLLTALVAPGTQAANTLKKVGISTEEMRRVISEEGILGALRLLEERTGGNIDVMRKIVPNVRALTGAFGLTVQEAEKVNDIFQNVSDAAGDLDDAFNETADTTSFKLNKALNDAKTLLVEIGSRVLPPAVGALDTFVVGATELAAALGFGPSLDEVLASSQSLVQAWHDGSISATELWDALQRLSTTTFTNIDLNHDLEESIKSAMEAEKAEVAIRQSAESAWLSYKKVLESGAGAYVEVGEAAGEAGASVRRFAGMSKAAVQDLADDLADEIPSIIGTVTTYKDTFTLSPADLNKIAESWARIAETIAADFETIAESDLKPAVKAAILALPPEMRHAWAEGNARERAAFVANLQRTLNFQSVFDRMRADFFRGGQSAVQGLIAALGSYANAVAEAAADLAQRAVSSMNQQLERHSPSRVTYRIGVDFARGMADGIEAGGKATRGAVERMAKQWTRDLERALRDAQDRLAKVLSEARGFRDAIAGGFASFLDISGILSVTPEGGEARAPTTEEALAFFAQQMAGAQQFADVLQALQTQGASQVLLQQIAGQGPEAIGLAQALLQGGPAAIEQANAALAVITALQESTSKGLTEVFFGEKIDELRAEVRGLRHDLRGIGEGRNTLTPQDIEEAMVRALRRVGPQVTPIEFERELDRRFMGAAGKASGRSSGL